MANTADDGRSISSRNVPISVASSSKISNTSTLPRITDQECYERQGKPYTLKWVDKNKGDK
eukprot:5619865-Amphidinium_carterae.1